MTKINTRKTVLTVLALMSVSVYAHAAPYKPVTKLTNGTLDTDVKPQPVVKVGKEYELNGITYTPKFDEDYDVVGIASWYGEQFHGKLTSNGEVFDMEELTAAHPTLQLPSFVEVTNLENNRKVIVRVNDRGPYSGGRQIDLSKRAAELLGFKDKGTANVRIRLLKDVSKQAADELNKENIAAAKLADKDIAGKIQPAASEDSNSGIIAPVAVPAINPGISVTPVSAGEPNKSAAEDVIPNKEDLPSLDNVDKVKEDNITSPKAVKIALEEPDSVKKYIPRGVFVQVGAFSENNDKIKNHVASLSDMGVVSLQKVDVAGRDVLRLRVGPYGSIDDAVKIKDKLVGLGYTSSRVVVEQ